MEKSIQSNAINYGLYLGGLLALWTILCYAVDLALLVNFWMFYLVIPIIVISFGVVSVAKSKSLLDGFISFKEAFTSYFITIALGVFISTIVSFALFNFIDPDAAIEIKTILVEKIVNTMEGFNLPAEAVSEAVSEIENQDMFSLGRQALGMFQSIIFFSVIGLIVAAIMKKNNPDAE